MYHMSGLDQEYLYVILLDTRNRVIGQPLEVYHGSLNTSLIRAGEIFREAGGEAEQRRPEIESALRRALARHTQDGKVVMQSSSWTITARNPA